MSGSRPDRNRPSRLERRQQALLDKLNGLEQGLCRFETLLRAADEKEECTDHSLEPVSATAGGSEIALADPTITTLVQPPQHRHSQYQQDVRHDQHDSKRDSAVVKHFLNLTDGLEVLPDLSKIGVSFDQVQVHTYGCQPHFFWPVPCPELPISNLAATKIENDYRLSSICLSTCFFNLCPTFVCVHACLHTYILRWHSSESCHRTASKKTTKG